MSTETITVTNYAPDRFARLEASIADGTGLPLAGNSGEAKKFGADVKYDYDPAKQVLTLTVLHGPHLHNFDAFCRKLQDYVTEQK